ncbi:MAG: hypothetical protein A2169_13640 [Deltaproteobacteria bacterium RBG_13_47_9]|nr:MAG: hypothetical protein A2169_13640 [Deltaproteobacteria bacterium RBG_13_47_9]
MTIYEVFYKNYGRERAEIMGVLIERRKDTRGMTQVASGLRWARMAFAHLVKDKQSIFAVPRELDLGTDATAFAEKAIFSKDEFARMIKSVEQEREKAA